MKVKSFRFRVSNWTSNPMDGDLNYKDFWEMKKEVYEPEQIDEVLNDFLKTVNYLIDFDVTPVEVNKHNNGRGNAIDLIYTIVYK